MGASRRAPHGGRRGPARVVVPGLISRRPACPVGTPSPTAPGAGQRHRPPGRRGWPGRAPTERGCGPRRPHARGAGHVERGEDLFLTREALEAALGASRPAPCCWPGSRPAPSSARDSGHLTVRVRTQRRPDPVLSLRGSRHREALSFWQRLPAAGLDRRAGASCAWRSGRSRVPPGGRDDRDPDPAACPRPDCMRHRHDTPAHGHGSQDLSGYATVEDLTRLRRTPSRCRAPSPQVLSAPAALRTTWSGELEEPIRILSGRGRDLQRASDNEYRAASYVFLV